MNALPRSVQASILSHHFQDVYKGQGGQIFSSDLTLVRTGMNFSTVIERVPTIFLMRDFAAYISNYQSSPIADEVLICLNVGEESVQIVFGGY